VKDPSGSVKLLAKTWMHSNISGARARRSKARELLEHRLEGYLAKQMRAISSLDEESLEQELEEDKKNSRLEARRGRTVLPEGWQSAK
jgi:hypothetical protein